VCVVRCEVEQGWAYPALVECSWCRGASVHACMPATSSSRLSCLWAACCVSLIRWALASSAGSFKLGYFWYCCYTAMNLILHLIYILNDELARYSCQNLRAKLTLTHLSFVLFSLFPVYFAGSKFKFED
jgi:hypothetical protein